MKEHQLLTQLHGYLLYVCLHCALRLLVVSEFTHGLSMFAMGGQKLLWWWFYLLDGVSELNSDPGEGNGWICCWVINKNPHFGRTEQKRDATT